MMQRIVIAISGIGLVYLGMKVILTGGHFVKGFHSNYGELKTPAGVLFILFGCVFLVAAVLKRK